MWFMNILQSYVLLITILINFYDNNYVLCPMVVYKSSDSSYKSTDVSYWFLVLFSCEY